MQQGSKNGRGNAHRQTLDERLEELETVLVVRLALDEMLEDTEHGRNLTSSDNLLSTAAKERSKETNKGRDVSSALPKGRGEERGKEDLVRIGHVVRRVELEELREDLEDEGSELRDVLLEDEVERREEGGFEGGEGGGVGGGDEADEGGDGFESEVVELGVRGVLRNLAEDRDEVLEDGGV
jgi:hypothetical protein